MWLNTDAVLSRFGRLRGYQEFMRTEVEKEVGGFYKAREIASICGAANVGVHVGSTAGSRLMEAAQLHFTAAVPELIWGG